MRLTIKCRKCESELDVIIVGPNDKDTEIEVNVAPCDTCIDDAVGN